MNFEGFPYVIGWELTLYCNLRCRHCGSAAGTSRSDELTLDEALKLCDQFPALLVQEVDFTGGEPLLYPHWAEIASHLKDLSISTKIITNGLLLNTSTVQDIKDAGIMAVGVSLDGMQKTHDYIRGHLGIFRRALAGIQRVIDADIPVTVLTTANRLNVDELPNLFDLLVSIGVKNWQIQPIFRFGRVKQSNELELNSDLYKKLGTFVRDWWTKADNAGMRLGPADSYGYFTELDPRDPPWRGCPAGLLTCGITSNGKVKGCLSLPDHLIEGDLRKNDLWDIWFHPESFEYTRNFTVDQLGQVCRTCPMAEQCRGGCSAMSYGYTGCFHNDPLCFYRILNLDQTVETNQSLLVTDTA